MASIELRAAAQQALEVLKSGLVVSWHSQVITDLEAALAEPEYPLGQASTDVGVPVYVLKKAEPESCQYPDCVDNGSEGKCTRWLLAECSKSEDYKPQRPAEPVREPVYNDLLRLVGNLFDEAYKAGCAAATAQPQEPVQGPVSPVEVARAAERAHKIGGEG